ncbi:MAG: hypothetical protein WCL32_02335 [Planctomycetota bacterium]
MARCDEGYLCDVCGRDVEGVPVSDLYLRYVLGEVDPLKLPQARERHIRCNPAIAQYIVAPDFPPVLCTSVFAKEHLDVEFVRQEEARITRGWRRLQEIPYLGITIPEYPLEDVRAAWRAK